MFISIPKPQPLFDRPLQEFFARDPWNRQQNAPWVLALYRLGANVPSRPEAAARRSEDLPTGYTLGLFARHTNECRLLPYSLRCQWQQGVVEAEDLAPLLHRAERTRMKQEKTFPIGLQYRNMAIVQLVAGVPLAIAVPLLFATGHLEGAIGVGAFALFFLLMGAIIGSWYWFWRRNQKRLAKKWRQFRDELRGAL